ncbi:MAG: hypothetical protein A3I88_03785 [Candidatus Portnoybacteria bacterium RIFCSPLOWO2_12_FULL_39_9]|uniref:Uncharacterized protein n=1 Tax=Candidatus Portnoybacteria bacterium RIFCSPHIGHO2_12_FULL_38_9 TaxID=1801997 RepID=A0A1G2FG49_9BACT|nr:MAG: hypothetical protein A3H00_03060 [Candidatus Portnoybacteria bacterium RBG_13_40_8]OGZ37023.1 MAG: hypothetical protein A3J64_01910 [Candidatus Portnoybacteria bacterium RIFCSPHIGHO2_12_FULL_38_9]OGZ38626.1 MAG: hypothetical protein A3F21_01230 [Candidatus Portnoybacteria bacterium RIFCSPLOWO2_01_FULL_38_39]OGZ40490.1 MAG: hypothetical protein A3I88_03785 [Candidatus Portnoybacteria bacterium RIFCSPLOWO2_12_FULL_39_9]
MIKIFLFNPKKIYLFLRAYQNIILAVIFALLLGLNVLIFYQYVYSVVEKQPEIQIKKTAVNREILQKILSEVAERRETLSRALKTEYPDPFK